MDQQGRLRPHRDSQERRFRRQPAGEKIRDVGSEEGGHDRLLLSLSSQHESDAQDRAVTGWERIPDRSGSWPRLRGGVIFGKAYCLEKDLLSGNVDREFAVADAAGKAFDELRHRVLAIGADELGKGRKQARLRQAVAVDAIMARFGPGLVEIAQCGLLLL